MRNELEEMSGNRVQMQHLKAEVFSTQILERILMRRKQLESLLTEELENGTKLSQLRETQMQSVGSLGLETALMQKLSDLERQKRDADQQCWRDVGMVIPHLLGAMEALQGAQARQDIIGAPRQTQMQEVAIKSQSSEPLANHYVQQYIRRYP